MTQKRSRTFKWRAKKRKQALQQERERPCSCEFHSGEGGDADKHPAAIDQGTGELNHDGSDDTSPAGEYSVAKPARCTMHSESSEDECVSSGDALEGDEAAAGPPDTCLVHEYLVDSDHSEEQPGMVDFNDVESSVDASDHSEEPAVVDFNDADSSVDAESMLADSDDPVNGSTPDDEGGAGEEAEQSSEDEGTNFSLNDASLNNICQSLHGCTKREAIAMVLSLAVRHRLSYEALVHIMIVINSILGRNCLPGSKKQLWRLLKRNSLGLTKHAYCKGCLRGLGEVSGLPIIVQCQCGLRVAKKNVSYFVSLTLKNQLKQFLTRPAIQKLLQYREVRQKRSADLVEDILDGQGYKRLQEGDSVLHSSNDFTYIFNTDGFKMADSSKTEAWALFVRLNELPVNVRQKHFFLAALWIDAKHPNMNLFLRQFVDQANDLSLRGITWTTGDGHEIHSRFFPTCCTADAKARCALLNIKAPTGYSSCSFCDCVGIIPEGGSVVKFPVPPHANVPVPERRTDAGIRRDMVDAHNRGEPCRGIHGPSELMNLNYFDLAKGFSTDDLHPIFIGVTKFFTELLVSTKHISENKFPLLSARLLTVKTPTSISRKPKKFEKRREWNGTEWRNWLIFYSLPCLEGILSSRLMRLLSMLASGVFLMMKQAISEQDFLDASRCFNDFVTNFQELFGIDNMRFNVHILTHVADTVREWGPLWAHSTFGFESLNHQLMKTVTSPKGAMDQIVTRFLLSSLVSNAAHDDLISHRVKVQVEKILNGVSHQNAVTLGGVHLLGKGMPREPTASERMSLAEHGITCDILTEYKRALYGGIELRSIQYTQEGLSDNSILYTWTDMFCSVLSIVVICSNEPEQRCGIFANVFNIDNPMYEAKHIVKVRDVESNEMVFINFSDVCSLAIKVAVTGEWYIMPLANHAEID